MASLTGNLVAETYKALLKTIDNDILTASEKQITDGLGGGSNVFIDSNGFLRANKYKVTNGLATQFLKADGSLDANTYLTSITSSQIITALGFTPVTNARTLTINGTTYDLSANRSWTVGGTAAVWGNITGTLSNQTDLQTALNAKFNNPTGTISQYIRGDGTLATFPAITGFVPYTGATQNVDLGTHTLLARDLVIDHASASGTAVDITKGGSGIAVNIEKSGAGEALTVVKSSGSGNAASITGGTTLISELHLTTKLADAYILSAATWNAKQNQLNGTGFVKASGTTISYDNSTYLTTADAASTYQLLTNLSTDLTASATKYPSVNAVIAGLATKQNQLNGTGLVRMAGTTVSYDNNSYVTGSGAVGYISSWNATTGLTNSSLFQSSGSIGLNITNVNYSAYGRAFTGASFAASSFGYEIASGATADGGLLGGLAYVLTENDASRRIGAKIESNVVGTTATNLGANLRFYVKADNAEIAEIARMTASGVTFYSGITATSFIKTGGTSNEYLRADGSVNVITGDIISGSGTTGYLSKFNSSSVIVSSSLFESGANIGFGTITLNYGSYGRAFTGAGFGSTAFGFEAVTGSTTNGGLIGGLSLVIASNDSTRRIGSAIQSYISGATSTHQGADLRFFVKPDNGVLLEVVRMTSAGITFNKDLTAANITATTFVKSGGTASEFLMADGSVSTLSSPVSGSGSAGYIPKWTSASNLGSSNIYSDGTSIGISYTTPNKGGYGRALSGAAFGSSSFGFEVVGGTTTNGGLLGGLSFIVNQNDSSRIVGSAIQSNLVGTTATNYGADLRFFAKADAVFTIAEVARMTSAGLRVYGTIVKDGGTSSQFLMADGSVTTGVANPVGGTGTTNYLPKWTSGSEIGNSQIFDNGTNVGIGIITPSYKLDVNGTGRFSNFLEIKNNSSNISYLAFQRNSNTQAFSLIEGNGENTTGFLRFITSDTPQLTISGNGTATFANSVLVKKNGSDSATDALALVNAAGNRYFNLQLDSAGNLAGWRYSGSAFLQWMSVNYSTGFVGINTNQPNKMLQVYAGNGDGISIGRNLTNDNMSANLFFFPSALETKKNWAISAYYTRQTTLQFLYSSTSTADPYTSGTPIMTLEGASGNVLINTTTDAGFKLDVHGTSRFKVSTDRNLTTRFDGQIILSAQSDTAAPESLRMYADTFRFYTATTAVGLTERFNISNTGTASFISNNGILVGANSRAFIRQTTGGDAELGASAGGLLSIFSNNLSVLSFAVGGTATFTTTENQGGLYVTSATDNTTLRIASTATGGQQWRLQSTGGGSGLGQGKLFFKVGGTETASHIPLVLTTDNGTNGGRVGIGTISPSSVLDVRGSNPLARIGLLGGGYVELSDNQISAKTSAGAASDLYLNISGARTILNRDGGNVLIATTSDNGFKFQVNGSTYFGGVIYLETSSYFRAAASTGYRFNNSSDAFNNFIIYENGNTWSRGSSTATSFFESSDFRLKTLIEHNPIIEGIEKLQCKLYEKNGKIEIGYFAQDAQRYIPYAVTIGTDGFLSLSYREVHTAKIARLEQRVAELEKQLNAA
jgi:hypothetical protein